MKQGLLLINLGTPDGFDVQNVRHYLKEFLTDKRVISIPTLLRYILVYGFILPFRPQKSSRAYQAIWTKEGSPLLVISKQLQTQLQRHLGSEYQIALGMRYGTPSIASALDELQECESITILPLYPQYASASTGSSLEETLRLISTREVIPSLKIISSFYQHPTYIKAQAQVIKDSMQDSEHLILSYHGIPERQIIQSGCKVVCQDICPVISETNHSCYKAQCHETSRLIAAELGLKPTEFTTTFQSRLGKTPWIRPYTDEVLAQLHTQGIKKLVVACPSFVTDCLETLEEIGMRGKEQWKNKGGSQFVLAPSLNTHPKWLRAITELIHQ